MKRVQIVWKWKRGHAPAGDLGKWTFAAHGARYDAGASADEMAAALRSHGKLVRFLPC